MRRRLGTAALVLALGTLGCDAGISPLAPDPESNRVPKTPSALGTNATIVWVGIEGGFWAIRGDDGVLYDPHPTIAAEFRQDGLRVWFRGTIRKDLACFHMVGPIVSVTELRPSA